MVGVGVTEAAAAASVFSTARRLLRELQQSGLSEKHAPLVAETLNVVNDGLDRVAQLQGQIIELQQRNKELREQLQSAQDWNARIGAYELAQTEGGAIVWASKQTAITHFVCPHCVESKKQIHILQPAAEWTGDYDCTACKASYDVKRPRPARDAAY